MLARTFVLALVFALGASLADAMALYYWPAARAPATTPRAALRRAPDLEFQVLHREAADANKRDVADTTTTAEETKSPLFAVHATVPNGAAPTPDGTVEASINIPHLAARNIYNYTAIYRRQSNYSRIAARDNVEARQYVNLNTTESTYFREGAKYTVRNVISKRDIGAGYYNRTAINIDMPVKRDVDTAEKRDVAAAKREAEESPFF
ncbi:hypothetical protein DRE_07362 [Drechslerella stenobrocha 248]|uniref:Uncharacterized protein n=1 Tax=Drechslerella stenobrocha 248 TaxID=1043628 RepID=W7HL37_9PEZI|nr:hypothetical protein DRE_07362 [Drechslerella stenobrocha 248]